jgi:hypothetical protein
LNHALLGVLPFPLASLGVVLPLEVGDFRVPGNGLGLGAKTPALLGAGPFADQQPLERDQPLELGVSRLPLVPKLPTSLRMT